MVYSSLFTCDNTINLSDENRCPHNCACALLSIPSEPHHAQTLRKPRMPCTTEWAEPPVKSSVDAKFVIAVFCPWKLWSWLVRVCHHLLPWMGVPRVLRVIFVLPFLNMSNHTYTLCWRNALSPYWTHKHVFDPSDTFCSQKINHGPPMFKVVEPCSLLHCSLLTAS
jgi:hypothetical protein